MNVFADNSNHGNKVKAGRKIAALRVRQRRRRESLRWSPSGKLRSSPSSRPPITKVDIPWNDRFIFDDESQHKGATYSKNRRIASRKGCDGKENIAKSNSSENRIRHYTERSDGDAVAHFQQIEVLLQSSAAAAGVEKRPSPVETRSIALSPFDMAKVKSALEADSLSQTKTPHIHFHETEVESMLDKFEELILTMEIEEELLRRDLELTKIKSEIKMPNIDMKTGTDTSLECNEGKCKSDVREAYLR